MFLRSGFKEFGACERPIEDRYFVFKKLLRETQALSF